MDSKPNERTEGSAFKWHKNNQIRNSGYQYRLLKVTRTETIEEIE